MPNSAYLILSFCFGLVVLSNSKYREGNSSQKPNVIIILTDDQGYGDFSCHGNPVLQTPVMDQLYSESVRLTDFHVAPMCTPTRGQLLTGMDAMRNGATGVCQGRSMIRNGIMTMADYFAAGGYATGHFGKWHLGDSYPHRPQDRGFQETLHHPAWGITSLADHFGNSYWDPFLRLASDNIPGKDHIEKQYQGYCTDIFFEEAMHWMKRQSDQNRPFFLYLPTNTPHVPNWVDKEYAEPYEEIGVHNGVPVPSNFYGMIANIDENLGRLEEFLINENLKESTLLIYLNDNGTQSRNAASIYNAGMRGHKTQMYDGGHRVACFFRWPEGNLLHGRDIEVLTHVQDILPTLADFCQLEMDRFNGNGHSLVPLLTDPIATLTDRKLVIQYSFQETSGTPWNRAIVLWNKWRLVGPHQLFDLNSDPHQIHSVTHLYPNIAAQMRKHYEDWYAEAKPLYDEPRLIHLGHFENGPVTLYSNDWVGGYCDNPPNLIAANTTGYWNVIVEQDGDFEIELRRWPEESGLALTAGVKGEDIRAHETFAGDELGARPIHMAVLKIGDFEESKKVDPQASATTFQASLVRGATRLETLFMDNTGMPLCSAIYVKVRKLTD
ncbi:MAG: arylsulfatase [Saprospiraceae bacterium]|nr:arylsulfatase [Saprospiraceae bacterium]